MCKASHYAETELELEDGKRYDISMGLFGLAFLTPVGQVADDCVACAKTGAVLTLLNIPIDLQQKFGLKSREVVHFVQTVNDYQDHVLFSNGNSLPLDLFANKNVGAYAGKLEDLEGAGDSGTAGIEDTGFARAEGWGGLTISGTREIVRG